MREPSGEPNGTRSNLAARYARACRNSPVVRRLTKHLLYEALARFSRRPDWTFMNYGYASLNGDGVLRLHENDEPNRYCIQLYHHVVGSIDLTGKRVLEVGCGRGGGSRFLKSYHRPAEMIGVDYSKQAVRLCHRTHKLPGLAFVHGDAENLPVDGGSFDAVVNVESSHCYGSMARFVDEVARVLRPGGHFLFADFRQRTELSTLEHDLTQAGLRVVSRQDITGNVLAALERDNERKMAQIRGSTRKLGFAEALLTGLMEEFAGAPGSAIYDGFRNGDTVYVSYALLA
jgi:ubiquinone/menaquinone biosynthesis C-methylase UbiE